MRVFHRQVIAAVIASLLLATTARAQVTNFSTDVNKAIDSAMAYMVAKVMATGGGGADALGIRGARVSREARLGRPVGAPGR